MSGLKAANNDFTSSWYSLDENTTLNRLNTSLDGLNELEVAERQKIYGLNRLPGKPPPRLFEVFLSQFKNSLIYVLIIAATVSLVLQEYTDAGFIFAVLVLNAFIGTFQEWRAEKSAATLQNLLKITVKVKRGGRDEILEAESLVPGDIINMESGNRVPADARMLRSNQISIDESLLTGESIAVSKTSEQILEDLPTFERKNMVYAGSTVMRGRGLAVVVAIGHSTEVGNIARTVTVSTALKPPLVIRMERFARQVAIFTLAATGALALIAYYQGIPLHEIFFFSVALAVAAIPEGLPVAITVALAIATKRMANRNVIIRKLTAVEGLGSCTLIASDKTGTLTVNKQTVKKIVLPEGLQYQVSGEGYNGDGTILKAQNSEEPDNDERQALNTLCISGCICNESNLNFVNGIWTHNGDAVDLALLSLTFKNGQDPNVIRREIKMIGEIPFESERKYAASFYQYEKESLVTAKGALETILPLCDKASTTQGEIEIDREKINWQLEELTQQGYRVLAIAYAHDPQPIKDNYSEQDIPPLTLIGLVGLIDPLRPEAKVAIQKCKSAGVDVAIVTGDHPLTALTIAKELRIAQSIDQVITGEQLEQISDTINDDFVNTVQGKRVFARVKPLQKMYIIEALNKIGHFVAVTGDGVNDVPALKKANIGVAMGSGTDLAKETAEIIVADDNFSSIEKGIEGGRFAYDNIRKVTYLLISTGASEIVLFLLSLIAGLPLPLVTAQLLWLNLVTNGIQDVGLAFEQGEPETMNGPPRRPQEGIFNRLMIQETLISGLVIGIIAFGAWNWLLDQGYEVFHARSLLLMLMVLIENIHVFNCRSEYISAFKVPFKRNWFVVGGALLAQSIHIIASNIPFMQNVLQTDSVSINEWFMLFALSLVVLIVMEIFKVAIKRIYPRRISLHAEIG